MNSIGALQDGGSSHAAVSRFAEEDRHVAEFLQQGYTVVPDAIPLALLDALQAVIEELEAQTPLSRGVKALSRITGHSTIRIRNLLNRDPIFQQVFDFDPVVSLAERLLGPQFLLQSCQTLCIGSGEDTQAIHTDDMYMDIPRPHAPLVFNTIWAITDFTEENGATRVAPGSHHWAETPRPTLAEIDANPREVDTICTAMKRGSIVAIDGAVWHGAGANRTDTRRAGLAVAYGKGWMRQQENFQLSIAPGLARTFSPRLREMCGFGLYQNFIGTIDGLAPEQTWAKASV